MEQLPNVEIGRLTAIADMLDDVVEKDFVFDQWVSRLPKAAKTTLFGLIETRPACGFAGCAMGWAAHNKLFPGFAIERIALLHKDFEDQYMSLQYNVDGDIYYSNQAVQMLLKINHRTVWFLFSPGAYKAYNLTTTTMVAQRIRRFVAKVESWKERDRRRAVAPVMTIRKPELVVA
jgi:hypothetical protein